MYLIWYGSAKVNSILYVHVSLHVQAYTSRQVRFDQRCDVLLVFLCACACVLFFQGSYSELQKFSCGGYWFSNIRGNLSWSGVGQGAVLWSSARGVDKQWLRNSQRKVLFIVFDVVPGHSYMVVIEVLGLNKDKPS